MEGVILVLGLIALGILAKYLRNRDRLRVREMSHRERVIALEKGVSPADLPDVPVTDAWVDEPWAARALDSGWDRRIALALGLLAVFVGAGGGVAIYFILLLGPGRQAMPTDAVLGSLTIACIIAMAGLGLLLYYRLTAPRSARSDTAVERVR